MVYLHMCGREAFLPWGASTWGVKAGAWSGSSASVVMALVFWVVSRCHTKSLLMEMCGKRDRRGALWLSDHQRMKRVPHPGCMTTRRAWVTGLGDGLSSAQVQSPHRATEEKTQWFWVGASWPAGCFQEGGGPGWAYFCPDTRTASSWMDISLLT